MSLYCVCISSGQQCLQLCPGARAAGGGCWCQRGAQPPSWDTQPLRRGLHVPGLCLRGLRQGPKIPGGAWGHLACQALFLSDHPLCLWDTPLQTLLQAQDPPMDVMGFALVRALLSLRPWPALPKRAAEAGSAGAGRGAVQSLSSPCWPLLRCSIPSKQRLLESFCWANPGLCSCKHLLLQSFLSAKFRPKSLCSAKPSDVCRTCGENVSEDVTDAASLARS